MNLFARSYPVSLKTATAVEDLKQSSNSYSPLSGIAAVIKEVVEFDIYSPRGSMYP